MPIEVLMKTTTDHNFVESAIYADIQLGLYGQPVIFSAACLARIRQRAARHLCFNIYVTQASVLRGCTGILYGINSTQNPMTERGGQPFGLS